MFIFEFSLRIWQKIYSAMCDLYFSHNSVGDEGEQAVNMIANNARIWFGCDVLHASLMHTSQCRLFSNKFRAWHALRKEACVTPLTILKCWKDIGPGTFTNSMRRKKHSPRLECSVYSLLIVLSLNMPGCPSTCSPRLRRSNDFLLAFYVWYIGTSEYSSVFANALFRHNVKKEINVVAREFKAICCTFAAVK